MLSAAAAYRSLLSPRHGDAAHTPIIEKVQILVSGGLLAAFFVLGFIAGASQAQKEPVVVSDAICAAPLASFEALKNAGCETGH